MLSALTIDDQSGTPVTLHSTTKRNLVKASGLVGVTDLRESRRSRPQAMGGIDETDWEDGRVISLEGEIVSSVSLEDCFTEFRLVTAPMIATLGGGNTVAMKWTEGTAGLQLQRMVRLAGGVDPPIEGGASILNYQASFYAEDPRAYSQTLTTVTGAVLSSLGGGLVMPFRFPFTFTSSGGGTVAFTNAGNRPTPPILRVYGMCVNPQIVNLATGARISLIGTIAAGDYMELDVYRRTVKLNGTVARSNFYDGINSTWFELPSGVSNLQLVAGSFDGSARLDILARSAYS